MATIYVITLEMAQYNLKSDKCTHKEATIIDAICDTEETFRDIFTD